MIKNFYFDKPYVTKDHRELILPLIVESDKGKTMFPINIPYDQRKGFPFINAFYDICEECFVINIPNPVCNEWPMLIGDGLDVAYKG